LSNRNRNKKKRQKNKRIVGKQMPEDLEKIKKKDTNCNYSINPNTFGWASTQNTI